MFASLFKSKPQLDDNTQQWIFDCFTWAVQQFDVEAFKSNAALVLPTNEYFPGSVNSVHEMALNMFNHTVKYAGMTHWPLRLVEPQSYRQTPLPQLTIDNGLRGSTSTIITPTPTELIEISYNPSQVNQPQDLISSFAQQLATLLVMHQNVAPPGGKEFVPQAIDVLACIMGFGVIFTNTAYQFRGGCGSCNNPAANRQAALPENEMCYSLALFCFLKGIPRKEVLPQLKAYLRGVYKKMAKEIEQQLPQSTEVALLALL